MRDRAPLLQVKLGFTSDYRQP